MISENSNLIRESRSMRRKTVHDSFFIYRYPPESYVRYLNNATVQAAIGAYVNYTEQSVAVASAFNTTGDDGRLDGTTKDVLALVEQGVIVCITSQSHDSRVSLQNRSQWYTEMQTTTVYILPHLGGNISTETG